MSADEHQPGTMLGARAEPHGLAGPDLQAGPDLRVGIVGYGLAGRVFHSRLLASTPGARVTAVVTRHPQRRVQAAQDHPEAQIVDDIPAAISAGLDLLVVAIANSAHVPAASLGIDAGVPVVVDKPLAVTAADARSLVEQADRRGVPLTVFQNRRWDYDQLTLRRVLADGRLGTVRRHESRIERWRPQRSQVKWRENAPASAGGGVLLDLGSHLIDQAVHLFGPVATVYAEVDARRGAADDDAFVALQHTGGVRSHLWASLVAGAPGPRLRVLGNTGAFLATDADRQEEALRAGRLPGLDNGWGTMPASCTVELRWGEQGERVPAERGRWDTFYPAVLAALRSGGPMPVNPLDAVTTLELIEAARRSARSGQPVELAGAGAAAGPSVAR